jgi:hypothetical protein
VLHTGGRHSLTPHFGCLSRHNSSSIHRWIGAALSHGKTRFVAGHINDPPDDLHQVPALLQTGLRMEFRASQALQLTVESQSVCAAADLSRSPDLPEYRMNRACRCLNRLVSTTERLSAALRGP